MTIDEIKQALHKADLILRPLIVFVNPSDAKVIKEVLPRIEEKIIIQETEAIESGKAIAIEREKLELLPEPYAERKEDD
jgi:formate-dependent phosphoribosylglycinamide formyltransferase (GAR transformylase)